MSELSSNQPDSQPGGAINPEWERTTLEKLLMATVREQRAARRWGIFFKLLTLGVIIFALWAYVDGTGTDMENMGRHTALIEIDGAIESEGSGSADAVIPSLNKAFSDVGSIGVLMDGFGFTGTMEKLGVERRLLTAGENKGFLDPFSAQSDKQKAHAQAMLNEIHQQFIGVVRTGRGKRLKETPEMFSGLFWTGAKAIDMGLADGFGTVESVARDVVKVEDIVDYTAHEGLPERVLKKFGAAVGAGAVKATVSNVRPQLR